MGNGVQHVFYIGFDNFHLRRDNSNTRGQRRRREPQHRPQHPSDLEQVPALYNFLRGTTNAGTTTDSANWADGRNTTYSDSTPYPGGTLLTNEHTPLISHTSVDFTSEYTGVYGDRNGIATSQNSEAAYTNALIVNGSGGLASSGLLVRLRLLDRPGQHDLYPWRQHRPCSPPERHQAARSTHRRHGSRSPRRAATSGAVAATGFVLENARSAGRRVDRARCTFTTADEGLAVHCANPQLTPAPSAAWAGTDANVKTVPDTAPGRPELHRLQRHVRPPVHRPGHQRPAQRHHERRVKTTLDPRLPRQPRPRRRSPGSTAKTATTRSGTRWPCRRPASRSPSATSPTLTTATAPSTRTTATPAPRPPTPSATTPMPRAPPTLSTEAALRHNRSAQARPATRTTCASSTQISRRFFDQAKADGFTTANTEFVFYSDENDHVAEGTPANPTCDGVTTPCEWNHTGRCSGSTEAVGTTASPVPGQLGETFVDVNATLPSESQYATQPYFINPDSAPEFYLENGTGANPALGTPAQTAPNVRQFERDLSAATYSDPYTGSTTHVVSYAADQAELSALQMVTADPLRTPTFVAFSPPDDFVNSVPAANAFNSSASAVVDDPGSTVGTNAWLGCSAITGTPSSCSESTYTYVHGDFAPETNDTWAGFVGPGVLNLGAYGGAWTDHTDILTTVLDLVGLHEAYTPDGRVITQIIDPRLVDPENTAALHAADATTLGPDLKELERPGVHVDRGGQRRVRPRHSGCRHRRFGQRQL